MYFEKSLDERRAFSGLKSLISLHSEANVAERRIWELALKDPSLTEYLKATAEYAEKFEITENRADRLKRMAQAIEEYSSARRG